MPFHPLRDNQRFYARLRKHCCCSSEWISNKPLALLCAGILNCFHFKPTVVVPRTPVQTLTVTPSNVVDSDCARFDPADNSIVPWPALKCFLTIELICLHSIGKLNSYYYNEAIVISLLSHFFKNVLISNCGY